PRELDEPLVARHEVGLAVDFDQHPDLVARVDVALDAALASLGPGPLRGLGLPLGPKDLDRAVEVTLGFEQRVAAIVDPGPGLLAEHLDVLGAGRGGC